MIDWLRTFIGNPSVAEWMNIATFFATPAVFMWVVPNVRALAVGVAITSAFWVFAALRSGQDDLPFLLESTLFVAVTSTVLCFSVMQLRLLFPQRVSESDAAPTDAPLPDQVESHPFPSWVRVIVAAIAVAVVLIILLASLGTPR